jgi:hypothetical protein
MLLLTGRDVWEAIVKLGWVSGSYDPKTNRQMRQCLHELVLPSRASCFFRPPVGAAVQALASATPLQAELSGCGARQLAVT